MEKPCHRGAKRGLCRSFGRFIKRYLSLAVALGALGYSIYQGRVDQQAARYSVRPILQLSFIAASTPEFPQVGLYVGNDGAGVALVDAMTPSFPGLAREADEAPLAALARIFRGLYPDFPPILFFNQVAQAIPPNTRMCLFGIASSDSTPERSTVLRQFLSQLRVDVRYHSLYNERFETHSQFE